MADEFNLGAGEFALDIPILNQVFKFQLTGTTRRLYHPKNMESLYG